MEKYNYLIIGGGMAAAAAALAIRSRDINGEIAIITEEPYPCYERPPLSKGLWTGSSEDSIWSRTEQQNVTFHLSRQVISIDPQKQLVKDHLGNVYWYQRLLIATGSLRNQLPHTHTLYTLSDYKKLRAVYDTTESFIVIGGGYIGTEISAALQMNGKKVTLIFDEPSLMSRKIPKEFSLFLNSYYHDKGVTVIPRTKVESVTKKGQLYSLKTSSQNKEIAADGLIAGIGTTPNTKLAEMAGLKCDNGILVNRYLQTSDLNIYAAGDVANFFCIPLGYRMRMEHEDAAKTMGAQAGLNMAGAQQEYTHLPYFYSDLFELGYIAMGKIGAHLQTVENWQEQYRKGIIYYLENEFVVGGMHWGIWDQSEALKELIISKRKITKEELQKL